MCRQGILHYATVISQMQMAARTVLPVLLSESRKRLGKSKRYVQIFEKGNFGNIRHFQKQKKRKF
jgi:hypothetical protein